MTPLDWPSDEDMKQYVQDGINGLLNWPESKYEPWLYNRGEGLKTLSERFGRYLKTGESMDPIEDLKTSVRQQTLAELMPQFADLQKQYQLDIDTAKINLSAYQDAMERYMVIYIERKRILLAAEQKLADLLQKLKDMDKQEASDDDSDE